MTADGAMQPAELLTAASAALVLAAVIVRLGIPLLARRLPDIPNARSSHSKPVPRGGGIGVVIAASLVLGLHAADFTALYWPVLFGGALLLALISLADDARPLPAAIRFAAQAAVVAAALWVTGDALGWPGPLPAWITAPLLFLAWLWFVNLYNFMDGIDGITAVESVSISAGLVAVWWVAGRPGLLDPVILAAATLGGAMLGFLLWNRHPARIFLGDVGSVPLGLVLGGLLILTAAAGNIEAAIILPLYYGADATITLTRRLLRGEKVWQAHREHFYQRAANENGRGPVAVTRAILVCNLGLILCAVYSVDGVPGAGLAIALLLVAGLLFHMSRRKT
jgi:UDP-N-acetylmuramyl pentapeptide phosphotransferase/UDP-N-acetylglucosamine-1-phosphate transferase